MGSSKGKKKVHYEAEDWCFVCKDGGTLLLCDHKGCGKAYHPNCVGKKLSVLKSDGRYICRRHKCSLCMLSTPQVYCLCCPKAVCELCVTAAEFVSVNKLEKGLCKDCLNRALRGENAKFDSKEVKLDSEDSDTEDEMFTEYLEIKMKEEGLTFDDLRRARMERENNGIGSGSDEMKGRDAVFTISDDDSHKGAAAVVDNSCEKRKKSEVYDPDFAATDNSCGKRKKSEVYNTDFAAIDNSCGKTNKSEDGEYVGWGSKALLNFLKSVGKDVSEKLQLLEVCITILEYIQEKSLFLEDQNVVASDEKLSAFFQKEVVELGEIPDLLKGHFGNTSGQSNSDENDNDKGSYSQDEVEQNRALSSDHLPVEEEVDNEVQKSSDKGSCSQNEVEQTKTTSECKMPRTLSCDNLPVEEKVDHEVRKSSDKGNCSQNEVEQSMLEHKMQRTLSRDNLPVEEKVDHEVQKNSYASVVAENIKLVYLSKSLVEELVMQPDNLENKVVGSFVRVKRKSGKFSEKPSFQLLQVTGIKKSIISREISLEVSCMPNDITIDLLGDDDISEEECEELRQRMKDGLLKKPTVGELEQKARSLHEDVTKNFDIYLDVSLESSPRRTFICVILSSYKCLDEREKLKKSSEQQRLLQMLPSVIAEETELDPTASNSSESNFLTASEKLQSLGCGKSYHPKCLRLDNSALQSKSRWICQRHNCADCGMPCPPLFYCLCCPCAVCDLCMAVSDQFLHLKSDKGLCEICLNLALTAAENAYSDSNVVSEDLEDPNKKEETMFNGYLEIQMKRECLTSNDIYSTWVNSEKHGGRSGCNKIHLSEAQHAHTLIISDSEENNRGNCSESEVEQNIINLSDLEENVDHQSDEKKSYASIIIKNINFVYLRRGLVEELLMQPGFKDKVVGSFIRVKTRYQKCYFQLLQVTGIKRIWNGHINKLFFEVSDLEFNDIPIDLLTNEDISEEECVDLRERIRDGVMRKPTVGELQEKADSLHEDITKHWIRREQNRLQKVVEYANRTLDEREKLKQPSEKQRLLRTLPRVIEEN
ncbi:Zinc finger, PHD-type [Corchorus olitorius]|uniref:Zinc finger, PHD-type n=1 Tax=Corchorus olitorius TaxID=93759 RepID=A0A1R3GGN8_9ROSI|nr:Zinc finger, PHD-type [Corchorus olitorius]